MRLTCNYTGTFLHGHFCLKRMFNFFFNFFSILKRRIIGRLKNKIRESIIYFILSPLN